ncbi:MAG: M20/M25/M40 family metallo-hydrolase [Kofleriaceae bacterium]|nr:M20/M25/M40 family metallo-hydrolase [Kofleriaceae bacterium]
MSRRGAGADRAAAAAGPGRGARRQAQDAPATADDPLGAASLMADVEWLAAPARHGRGSRSADARAVAAWLGDELRQAGYAPTTLAIPEVDDQVDVVAVYGPRDDLAPTIVVTAHYDHLGEVDGTLYPGADDNASGVAVALGVARDLAARRDVAGRVVFVFTGAEELGLYGARAYAEAPAYPLGQTRVVINLDMVGRRFFEGTADQDATLGAVGLPGDATLLELGEAAAAAAGVALVAVSAELLTLVGEDWRSDDWVFRDRGVPAVHLSTGLNPDYHQPTDTPDRVSRAQLERVARFLRGWVSRLAAR